MEKQRTHAWLAFLAGILLVAVPALSLRFHPSSDSLALSPAPAAVLNRPGPKLVPQTLGLLAQLKAVCIEDTTLNDYFATNSAQPTEHLRDEILNALAEIAGHASEPALSEIRFQMAAVKASPANAEYIEMLHLAALHLGDAAATRDVADLMIYSDFPAVRIGAARLLRKASGKVTHGLTRDYFIRALKDPRFVSNDGCGTLPDKYYPVRTIAALALRDMGVDVPVGGEVSFADQAATKRAP